MTVHPNDFPTALSELDRISETRKIPNALLFTGLPGSGKKQAAYRFAKAVNCAGKRAQPCNQCRSCRKINTNQHPDMIVVAPAKSQKTVLISQIREMIARTGTRPHEASYRMVLITEAGQMNPQAQNALLKELEEPPEKTFFILLARERSGLLPTILSRCQSLRFPPLSGSALAAHLSALYSIDTQWAGIAAATAGTDMDLAEILVGAPETGASESQEKPGTGSGSGLDWQTTRPWMIRQLCRLISRPGFHHIQTL